MSSWHMPEHVTGSHAGDTLSSSLNDSYLSSYFTRSATLSNDVQQVGANFADCFLQKCFYICRLKWLALFSYFLLSVCVWYCHHRLTVHYCIYVSSSVSVGLTPLMSTSLIGSNPCQHKKRHKGDGLLPLQRTLLSVQNIIRWDYQNCPVLYCLPQLYLILCTHVVV